MKHACGPRFSRAVQAASLGAFAIGVASCSSARPGAPIVPVASCVVGAAQGNAGDTLLIGTMAPVDWAHVPEPTNAAERFAFAQVYETLINVDCDGRARAGLAASWTLDNTRTRITLSLRRGAVFWSGKPVTANAVLAAWRATGARSTSALRAARLARAIIGGSTVVDDQTLIVSLADTGWLVLADRTLAVYEPRSASGWPEGSGPYRIAEQSADAPMGGGFVLTPFASTTDPYLVSRRAPSGDPRDAIDAGSDVLVTGDPLAANYAAARANLMAVPLPWSHTYALAVPDAAGAASKILQLLLSADSVPQSLARDAVHAQARAAKPPFWWDSGHACITAFDSLPALRTDRGRSNRLVYRREDGVARGLAERLVALGARTVAAGLAPNDFARAFRDGGDLGYVLDLAHTSLSPCADVAELRTAIPWLASSSADVRIVPLIDTRETAIVNRNTVSATFDWRGTLHFSGVGNRP